VPFEGVDTSLVLQAAMRAAVLNHSLIANNVANVDTPNYNPVSLDFQKTLRAELEGRARFALRRTDPRHLEGGRSLASFRKGAVLSKNDYNKVDLDEEMAKLSENTGRYVTYSSLLTKRFRVMKDMLTTLR
jgi:flagellar basal-body rod protein FlgB